tara:strand:+ start:260 stop:517 length:258 start_codon:yes stop_codon:yes gene_type:complete
MEQRQLMKLVHPPKPFYQLLLGQDTISERVVDFQSRQRIADLKLARLCCAEQQLLAGSDSIRAKDQGKKRTLDITKSDVCMDGKK